MQEAEVEMKQLHLGEKSSLAPGNSWSTSVQKKAPPRPAVDRWLDTFRPLPGRLLTPSRNSAAVDVECADAPSLAQRAAHPAIHQQGRRYFDLHAANLGTANTQLARELKSRHLQMIGIGGSIGTGLFVSSGKALSIGGPASLLLGYAIVGLMLYCTIQALGELAVVFPVSGAFSSHSTRFLDPSWGFAMGWNYAFQWLLSLPLEIIAAAIVVTYWNPGLNQAIFITLFLFAIVSINLFGVRAYGEAEFAFALIKVVAVIGFILLGIVINIGGTPTEGYIGAKYWHDPGAFRNGLKGFGAMFLPAAFAFSGTELVGLAAAETADPRKSLPTAIKQVFWRITLFYIITLALIGLLVAYDNDRLLGARFMADATASPFVIAIESAGIDVIPSIMNSVILVAVLSVGNSAIFGSSRTLAALADQGSAPRWLGYIDRKGRPLMAIAVASLLGFLAYLALLPHQVDVLEWLLAITSLSTILTWASICLSHIRFRRAWEARGRHLDELAFCSQAGVAGTWLGLVLNILVLLAHFWTAVWPLPNVAAEEADVTRGPLADFFLHCLTLPVVLACYLAHKLYFRTRFVRIHEIDVDTGRRDYNLAVLLAREKDERTAWPAWKRVYKFLC